jgi:hypothetical protein
MEFGYRLISIDVGCVSAQQNAPTRSIGPSGLSLWADRSTRKPDQWLDQCHAAWQLFGQSETDVQVTLYRDNHAW